MSHPLPRDPQVPALLSDKPFAETNPYPPRGAGGGRDFVHLLANAGAWPLPGPVRAVSLRPGQRCCSCSLRQEGCTSDNNPRSVVASQKL